MNPKHIAIFSHGFGVYADDRGLFPNIAAGLPDTKLVMFDYNQREANNTLIASTLEAQTEKLRQVYNETRINNPHATIDLICHSQGCVIAAMAQLEGIRKTIFLAPPDDTFGQNVDEKIQDVTKRKMRPGTKVFEDGSISYPRRDGSTTIIPREYWDSRSGVKPIQLYLALAEKTELIIVQATNDEVIGLTNFSELSDGVRIIQMDTGHDFEGKGRQQLIKLISSELGFKREVPAIIREVGLDISWDERKVWPLDYPVEEMSISELVWHYEIPFWFKPNGFYDLKPQEVVDNPKQYAEEYARTMRADTSHPIDVMFWRGRWLILDGLHRLLKQTLQGARTVKVRKIPESEKQHIMKDKVNRNNTEIYL